MTQRLRRFRPVVPFRSSVLALAMAAGLSMQANIHAAEVGHARMVSAAGQPLQLVVPLLGLSADEAASLDVDIPPAAAWSQAGLKPPVPLDSLRVRVEPGLDGTRRNLRVFSTQPPAQPVVDILLEVATVAGSRRVQRSFVAPSAEAPGAPSPAVLAETGTGPRRIDVRRGDTLFEIAQRNQYAGANVFQMLVALWQANPRAFIQSNMNLVKAGESLALPDAATVRAIDPREALRIFREHDEAFARYRGRLGSVAAAAPATAGGSPAAGRLEAAPAGREGAPQASQDRVRLSAGTAQQAGDERVAQQRDTRETEARVAQLESNVDQLNRALSGGSRAGGAQGGAAEGGGAVAGANPGPGVSRSDGADSDAAGMGGNASGAGAADGGAQGNGSQDSDVRGGGIQGGGAGSSVQSSAAPGDATQGSAGAGRNSNRTGANGATAAAGSDTSAAGETGARNGTPDASSGAADTAKGAAPGASGDTSDAGVGAGADTGAGARTGAAGVDGASQSGAAGSQATSRPDSSGGSNTAQSDAAGGRDASSASATPGASASSGQPANGSSPPTSATGAGAGAATGNGASTGTTGSGASPSSAASSGGQGSASGSAPGGGASAVSPAQSSGGQAGQGAGTSLGQADRGASTPSSGGAAGGADASAESRSFTEWLSDNLLGVVTAVLAILALIIAWAMRRAGAREDDYDDYDDAPGYGPDGAAKASFDDKLQDIDLDLDTPPRDERRR